MELPDELDPELPTPMSEWAEMRYQIADLLAENNRLVARNRQLEEHFKAHRAGQVSKAAEFARQIEDSVREPGGL